MRMLKSGATYFALVFGAGFALGTIRVLWLLPRMSTRAAELIEMPVMLAVTILAARWVMQRLPAPRTASARLGVGFTALALLLVAEFATAFWLRGMTVGEYLASRDPVSGNAFLVMLVIFAVMPLFVARR